MQREIVPQQRLSVICQRCIIRDCRWSERAWFGRPSDLVMNMCRVLLEGQDAPVQSTSPGKLEVAMDWKGTYRVLPFIVDAPPSKGLATTEGGVDAKLC